METSCSWSSQPPSLTLRVCASGRIKQSKHIVILLKHLHLVAVSLNFPSLQQPVGQKRLPELEMWSSLWLSLLRTGQSPPATYAFGTCLTL